MALKMILVKVSLSGISFVLLGVKEETLLIWLDRAYQKAEQINAYLLKELPVTEVELDEMWSFIKRMVFDQGEIESPQGVKDGRQWIWISYAPQFRLILATVVGPRTYESALTLIQLTASIVLILGVPCFFSDGFSCYLQALIECYHQIKTFARTGKIGRPRNPVKEPHPDLVYGQVVKEMEGGRIKNITHHVKCGVARLAQLGLTISTTLLERLNLTFRQALAPLCRKTLSFSKDKENLKKQVVFFQAFYNFTRPHMSLREVVSNTNESFKQKWRQRTPGMAAGLTDYVWSFRELLTIKFSYEP